MKFSTPYTRASVLPFLFSSLLFGVKPALSLPPPTDIPEEVLRTEIITEGRSPLDGKPLTAPEYAQLQQLQQESGNLPPQLSSELRHLIFLSRLRKLLQKISPIPINIHL